MQLELKNMQLKENLEDFEWRYKNFKSRPWTAAIKQKIFFPLETFFYRLNYKYLQPQRASSTFFFKMAVVSVVIEHSLHVFWAEKRLQGVAKERRSVCEQSCQLRRESRSYSFYHALCFLVYLNKKEGRGDVFQANTPKRNLIKSSWWLEGLLKLGLSTERLTD